MDLTDSEDEATRAVRKGKATSTGEPTRLPQKRRRSVVDDDDHSDASDVKDEDVNASDINDDPNSDASFDEEDDVVDPALMRMTQQKEEERRQRRVTQTASSESGVIESVTLVNFMPQVLEVDTMHCVIAPVIGHNGSGKSAVLTAITVCLGGKATATNRATSLRSFIREGETHAEVTLFIRNRGADAYRPDVYGDRIVIIRSLSTTSSGYKIKGTLHPNKIISTRRDELVAICDHMALQPDNPILILSQDAARQFLASSKPAERYQLFLRGTLLAQLQDDYEKLKTAMAQLRDTVKRKRQLLPDLQADLKRATRRVKELELSVGLERKILEKKHHLAWSQVYEAEDKVKELEQNVAEAKLKVELAQRTVDEHLEKAASFREEAEGLSEKLNQQQEAIQPYVDGSADIDRRLREQKAMTSRIKHDRNEIQNQIDALRKENSVHEKKIAAETQKSMSDVESDLCAAKKTEYDRITAEYDTLNARWKEMSAEMASLPSIDDMTGELKTAKYQLGTAQSRLKHDQDRVKELEGAGTDRLFAFGGNLVNMMKEMRTMDTRGVWKGGLPIGPIGLHVKLRDPERWALAIDAAWSAKTPYAFIVQHRADIPRLLELFRRFQYGPRALGNNRQTGVYEVYFARYDRTFDCRTGMPEQNKLYTTVYEQIEVDNELVLQVLVNQHSIESTILVESRQDGERVTARWPRNVSACYDTRANKIGNRSGGNSLVSYNSNGMPLSRTLCGITTKDHLKMIRDSLPEKQHIVDVMQRTVLQIEERIAQTERRQQELQVAIDRLKQDIRRKENARKTVREEIIDMENDMVEAKDTSLLQTYQKARDENESRIEAFQMQFPPIFARLTQSVATENEIAAEREALRSGHSAMIEAVETATKAHQDALAKVAKADTQAEYFANGKRKYEKNLEDAQNFLRESKHEMELTLDQAMEFCDDVTVAREELKGANRKQIERELRQLEELLERTQEELGSLDEAVAKSNAKQAMVNAAERDIASSERLANKLSAIHQIRVKNWLAFRQFITLRTKFQFEWLLQQRSYSGKLLLDHTNQNLHLKVDPRAGEVHDNSLTQPVNPTSRSDSRRKSSGIKKDPRGLSGGEKSFTTVCLLLAMWQAMDSRLRALDEFDVFMDSVNRRIATAMLLEAAEKDPCCQFIMITPQSMDNVRISSTVKVIKMTDPERRWQGGQQTLDQSFAAGTSR